MSLGRNGARQGSSALPSYYGANTVTTRDSQAVARSKARAGPNRTTKASGKLKILPEEPEDGGVNSSGRSASHRQAGAASQAHERFADGLDVHSAREVSIVDDDDDESSEDDDDDGEGEEHRAKLSKQLELARIPEGSMRRDARRITRKGRATLPRVTAYSTATSYRMRELTKWLQGRRDTHRTNAMTFDECVYSTYSYDLVDQNRGLQHDYYSHTHQTPANGVRSAPIEARLKVSSVADQRTGRETKTADLLGIPELHRNDDTASSADAETAVGLSSTTTLVDVNVNDTEGISGHAHTRYKDGHDDAQREGDASAFDDAEKQRQQEADLARREEAKRRRRERFAVHGMVPEVFLMEYGTVVIWGMTVAEEKRLLRELRRFEVEKLAPEDVESEDLNWYLADYSRIYNDVITLRKGSSYMTKLSLSHALAQSTKISFFEGVIDNTIDTTKDIPQSIAESGKIGLPPVDIMKQIGHLFILRMNIHLVGSIVDSPEIFWAQPDLEPLYSAARSYLEIPQRIELLNARVEVLQDMLQLLKDQVTSSHSEWLEIIVIVLILLEIILGVATMVVDLYFA